MDKTVGFIGDGINDSPALKQANVSLSFSQSTQIAQSVSDIIIFKGGLEILNKIFNISKNSNKRIIQNLFFAFIYNIIMIPIAVSGSIVPSMAALAMALSSLSVVLNSSRKL
jgi:P-type E1-E2 ATPase|tara:strand:- start:635 stop:970 length:336 start_codon:yes stop_codon:yes gene_type:complete